MKRRDFLTAMGLGAWGICSGCGLALEEGIFHPCLSEPLPDHLRNHEVVGAAWEGIDPGLVWDCHAHIAGVGDGNTGVWITPQMKSPLHPWQNLQRRFYLNAACTHREGSVDEDFVGRLISYLEDFPRGVKAMLLAFDFAFDETGSKREDRSTFHVPNHYGAELARRYPERLEWMGSVHPYRDDALVAVEWAKKNGARAVKWLPSAMGIDPLSAKCDRFYENLRRLNLPLLTHGGAEHAVHSQHTQELNNPLRLRRPLDHGVRVIVAHCATLGEHMDLDRGPEGPRIDAFALFARLMDEPRYEGHLFGDLSSVAQANRVGPPLAQLLLRSEWHGRLVNGSDYPLPGVMPLFSLRRLAEQGYLTDAQASLLSEIRRYNPLLFDFVLKRTLAREGRRFAPAAFETRRLFDEERSRNRSGSP